MARPIVGAIAPLKIDFVSFEFVTMKQTHKKVSGLSWRTLPSSKQPGSRGRVFGLIFSIL